MDLVDRTEPVLASARRLALTALYRTLLTQRARYRALLARVSPDLLATTGGERVSTETYAEIGIPAVVVVYFADSPSRAYQIDQWIPVFEKLHERFPVLVATRSIGSFDRLGSSTCLPIVFARRLRNLEDVLQSIDPKVCLYVNNSTQNFQALSWRRAFHVHLNHGESDKISMASNQVKAYDFAFVAGEAAENRYRENLLGFDHETLVRVGRPQLDLDFPPVLRPAGRSTVMYAPTWEGDTPAMDYTSLPKFGPNLVQRLLAHGGFRVVYKPHPRVTTGSPPVTKAHEQIVKALTAANQKLPADERHVVEVEGAILPLFAACDLLVCDVSSVALDWLYLKTDEPLWICDPYDDRERLVRASPLAARTGVLDGSSVDSVAAVLQTSLDADALRTERHAARRFYFGDLSPGDSTRRFLEAMDDVVARRDALLDGRQAATGVEVGAAVF